MRDQARPFYGAALRAKGKTNTRLRTLFGTVGLRTTRWVESRRGRVGRPRTKRHATGSGMLPVLWWMDVRAGCTPALQAEVGRALVVCACCREAAQLLAARGIKCTHRDVCRIGYDTARRSIEQRDRILRGDEGMPRPKPILHGKRVLLSLDGGRFKARFTNKSGRRTAKGRRGFTTAWKEPKGFIIYVINEHGEPDRSITPLCDFTTGDAATLMRLILAYLKAYGIEKAALLEVVADGACWIWNRVDELRVDLRLAEHGVELVEVLDFYHAAEYLSTASTASTAIRGAAARKRWYEAQRRQLRHGRPQAVLDALDEMRRQVSRRYRKSFDQARSYLAGHVERMEYAKLHRRRLVLGSGAMESAIRRVVNQRVKGNGCFWCMKNAELVMHMRAQLKFGRFDELIARATAPHPYSA